MSTMKSTWQCGNALWEEVCVKVKRAVVYMDNSCAEMLHWHGGMTRLLAAGAVDVREFSSFETGRADQMKAVFVVSSLLRDSVTKDVLRDVLGQSSFQYVVVITTASANVHAYDRTGSGECEDRKDFEDMEDLLLQWMGNMNYTAEVLHVPVFTADLCPGVFVTPAFTSLFPLLDTDIQQVQIQQNATSRHKAEKKVPDSLSDIDSNHLPKTLQTTFKRFACSLHGLLSDLGVREDLYSLGHTSRMLATEVENYPPAKVRRKNVSGRGSVVLIDRSLDLATPVSHQFETLLDKMTSVLPRLQRHNTDVTIDMSPVCAVTCEAGQNVIVPGCLAPGPSHTQPSHLQTLITAKHKECLLDVNRRLVEAASQEKLPVHLAGRPGRVTAEQLDTTLALFKGNYKAIQPHLDTLQVAMATSQALQHPKTGCHDTLVSTEKNLVQVAGDDSSGSPMSYVLTLLKDELKQPPNDRSHSLDDILAMLTFLYSLCGEELEDAENVQKLLVQAVMSEKERLPPVLKTIVGDAHSESIVLDLIEDMWSKLLAVSAARQHLKQFRSVLEPSSAISPANMKPLLKTVMEHIVSAEKPELPDVEFRSSGFKDLLKSGFGLFMNVSKPRPSDHPLLIVYIVGGITSTEIKQMRDVVDKAKTGMQVVIGSTRLLRTEDVLQAVFLQNNVDPESV